MRRLSTAFALLILLTGCSANWHLKRAIQKNPAILTDGVVVERVTDTIEVITPELRVDTLHRFSRDTVTTYVDRVKIRTKVDTIARTVYVDVVCPGDTIYVPYEYDKTVIQPRVKHGLDWWWLLIALIVGGFLIALLRRS
jgi:hypothetical protein